MFIEIDNWLIKWAQFIVWFIELYTRFTKRTVAIVLLGIIKNITWSNLLFLTVHSLHSFGYTLFFLMFACALLLMVCNRYDSLINEGACEGSKIRENLIKNARLGRLIQVYISLIQISLVMSSILFNDEASLFSTTTDVVANVSALGVCISFVCSTVVEYILCSQSIPPRNTQSLL